MSKAMDKLKAKKERLKELEKSMREKITLQKKRLKAQMQKAQAVECSRGRKLDTRKKILIGAWVLNQLDKEIPVSVSNFTDLEGVLDGFLDKKRDRELFGLTV